MNINTNIDDIIKIYDEYRINRVEALNELCHLEMDDKCKDDVIAIMNKVVNEKYTKLLEIHTDNITLEHALKLDKEYCMYIPSDNGFWRHEYEYPIEGDHIRMHTYDADDNIIDTWYHKVISHGFLTFCVGPALETIE